ncbi:hypothetical protein [Teredinibacter sp. KSP-S5-2]|uniref:hypothetical protein n=1 Tax=Teredinibacter sp. KSP-S5-2 TaxID=3034506 RepID=UPI0029342E4E|nr:hypothetical protein [Teredinibacter sp. KSP-S5-2]WNO10839.1 hypothetical protein P5V12_06575 [Teredinibacter sp. KSP-S5-2]
MNRACQIGVVGGVILFISLVSSDVYSETENFKRFRTGLSFASAHVEIDRSRIQRLSQNASAIDDDGFSLIPHVSFYINRHFGIELSYQNFEDDNLFFGDLFDGWLSENIEYEMDGYSLLALGEAMSPYGLFVRGKAGTLYARNELILERNGDVVKEESWSGFYPKAAVEMGYAVGHHKRVSVEFAIGASTAKMDDTDLNNYYFSFATRF